MMIKWTKGNEQVMRQLVEENEAESEMTKIRVTSRSGRDTWNRAQVMKTVWNEKQAMRNDKEN